MIKYDADRRWLLVSEEGGCVVEVDSVPLPSFARRDGWLHFGGGVQRWTMKLSSTDFSHRVLQGLNRTHCGLQSEGLVRIFLKLPNDRELYMAVAFITDFTVSTDPESPVEITFTGTGPPPRQERSRV